MAVARPDLGCAGLQAGLSTISAVTTCCRFDLVILKSRLPLVSYCISIDPAPAVQCKLGDVGYIISRG